MLPLRRHNDPAIQTEVNNLCRWITDLLARADAANELIAGYQADLAELEEVAELVTSETAPDNPPEGKHWLDTSVTPAELKVYANGAWVVIGPEESGGSGGSGGDALVGEILAGKTAWVGGTEITGTMPNVGQQTVMPGTSAQAITQGYHDGTGSVAGDTDLIAENIKKDVVIFGVTGTHEGGGGGGGLEIIGAIDRDVTLAEDLLAGDIVQAFLYNREYGWSLSFTGDTLPMISGVNQRIWHKLSFELPTPDVLTITFSHTGPASLSIELWTQNKSSRIRYVYDLAPGSGNFSVALDGGAQELWIAAESGWYGCSNTGDVTEYTFFAKLTSLPEVSSQTTVKAYKSVSPASPIPEGLSYVGIMNESGSAGEVKSAKMVFWTSDPLGTLEP